MKEMKSFVISVCLFLFVAMLAMGGVANIEKRSAAEEMRTVENHLKEAVITCYALEGRYPPDLQYLYDNYGLRWNEKKFHVQYRIFAENIMPEITVEE